MSEEKEQQARIEEFIKGNVPVQLPKGKFIVLVGSWVIFILIGIFALIDIVGPQAVLIATWLSLAVISQLWIPILILMLVSGAIIVFTVWAMIRLLKNHGYGLLKFSIILSTVMTWVLVIIVFILVPFTVEMLFMLIMPIISTVLTILYFTIWKTRLELAGGILTITGRVTHEEKGLMVPGFLKVLFVGILGFFGAIIGADILIHMMPPSGDLLWWHYAVEIIYAFVLFLYLYINTYFFNAIVSSITYIWYRKKDPTFKDGLAIATYQLPDIALFAVFSSIVRVIRMVLQAAAKRSHTTPGWSGGGFRLADGIIGSVWYYVNYFTLPAIVIEDVPTTTAIKRSAHRLFDNWVDVLLKEWGVSKVFSTLQFLIVILFALAGGLFGWLLSIIYTLDLVVMIVIGVILFILISTLVAKPFLNLLNDIYLTFLFGFVIDKETNFKYENNLPKDLNDKLKDWFKSHPAVQRCQKCFAKVPEGATSCPKCGAPYP